MWRVFKKTNCFKKCEIKEVGLGSVRFYFLKEINMQRVTVKTFIMLENISILNNAVLLNFYSSKDPDK